jgi:hypothetical protein
MSIEGMDLEQQLPPAERQQDDTNQPPAHEDDDDGLIETVKVGEQKMVPVGDLIKYRKDARDAKRQLAEINQRLSRAEAVEAQLNEAAPILNAIKANPKLLDAVTKGTRATAEHVDQPQDDQDAKDTAEDMGFYTTDGQLDVARGRRVLDRATARAERKMEERLGPIRQQTAETSANAMRNRVDGMRTKDGAPLATKESLDQIFGMVPAELRADPRTAFVMTLAAAGMDLYSGRKPAAPQQTREYNEPIYTEPAGRRGGTGVSAELAALGKRVGLTEKDLGGNVGTTTRGGAVSFE